MEKLRDVVRMLPLDEGSVRFDESGDGNTLVLEPIVFNRFTEIKNPWEGHFLERIAPQAVTKTIAERGDQIKILFNHGMDPSIGKKPLGPIRSLEADKESVRAEVPLSDTSYNRDLKALLRDGALDGSSFRFDILNYEEVQPKRSTKANPEKLLERTITEIRLYEFGPVTFPAYQAATAGIRSVEDLYRFQAEREAGLPEPTSDPLTGEPGLPHSTAARRSMLLRKLNEALADERNGLLLTKE